MRAKLIFGMFLLAIFALATSARAENQAAKIPHNAFWGYWDSGPFDPRSVGLADGDAFHVTVCGPVGELLSLEDMDMETLKKVIPLLGREGNMILYLSDLAASMHPWYSTILNNQKYGKYFLIAIEPVGEGYENRRLVWPKELTVGLVTVDPTDTIAAAHVVSGKDFTYETRKGKDVDTNCTPVSLFGDGMQTTTDMPFTDLVCKRSGIRMPRGILAVPLRPAGFPDGWTWRKDNVIGVVWLWNGHPIAQTVARQ